MIAGGLTGPTLRELTGAPSYTYHFDKGQEIEGLWEAMVEGEELHYGMSSGTSGRDEGETDDKGIVPGHAYTLIAAREITNKDGDTERLVKLRNPWKRGEWNGKYSDADDAWTDELKEELEWSDENDGIFWMTFEDMCHNYDCIDICKIDDNNRFSYC